MARNFLDKIKNGHYYRIHHKYTKDDVDYEIITFTHVRNVRYMYGVTEWLGTSCPFNMDMTIHAEEPWDADNIVDNYPDITEITVDEFENALGAYEYFAEKKNMLMKTVKLIPFVNPDNDNRKPHTDFMVSLYDRYGEQAEKIIQLGTKQFPNVFTEKPKGGKYHCIFGKQNGVEVVGKVIRSEFVKNDEGNALMRVYLTDVSRNRFSKEKPDSKDTVTITIDRPTAFREIGGEYGIRFAEYMYDNTDKKLKEAKKEHPFDYGNARHDIIKECYFYCSRDSRFGWE